MIKSYQNSYQKSYVYRKCYEAVVVRDKIVPNIVPKSYLLVRFWYDFGKKYRTKIVPKNNYASLSLRSAYFSVHQ